MGLPCAVPCRDFVKQRGSLRYGRDDKLEKLFAGSGVYRLQMKFPNQTSRGRRNMCIVALAKA